MAEKVVESARYSGKVGKTRKSAYINGVTLGEKLMMSNEGQLVTAMSSLETSDLDLIERVVSDELYKRRSGHRKTARMERISKSHG